MNTYEGNRKCLSALCEAEDEKGRQADSGDKVKINTWNIPDEKLAELHGHSYISGVH